MSHLPACRFADAAPALEEAPPRPGRIAGRAFAGSTLIALLFLACSGLAQALPAAVRKSEAGWRQWGSGEIPLHRAPRSRSPSLRLALIKRPET